MEGTFISLTEERYRQNLEQAATLGAHKALLLAGLPIKEWYTRTEMQRRHGKRIVNDMIAKHRLTPHQLPAVNGENKRIVYSETEFLSQIF
jgi:hypothetical protein